MGGGKTKIPHDIERGDRKPQEDIIPLHKYKDSLPLAFNEKL